MKELALWLFLLIFGLLVIFSITLAQAQPTCVQPPPGMVSWWSLDETSGMTAEERVGNNPGAHANGPVPADGMVRGALRFDGKNDYVAVADSDIWAFGADDFTIELWANFDKRGSGSLSHPGDIFIGNDEGPRNRRKWFFALGGGVLNFHINGPGIGPKFFPRVSFSPIVGQWYHLAVVRKGSTYTIFVDGTPGGSAKNTDVILNPNAPLTIGQAENLGFMNGRLDEISIYNRALTQEELQAIYDAGIAGKCIDLTIRPDKGGDTGSVSVHLNGTGFAQGATVKLVRTGEPDILGAPVTVGENGTTIDTTFDLTGKTRGVWDIVVENPDETSFTLPESFTIEEGQTTLLWVDIVGLPVIRVGREQNYWILVGNSGNVDAPIGHIFLQVPEGVLYRLGDNEEFTSLADGDAHYLIVFDLYGGGTTQAIPLTLFVQDGSSFQLSASAFDEFVVERTFMGVSDFVSSLDVQNIRIMGATIAAELTQILPPDYYKEYPPYTSAEDAPAGYVVTCEISGIAQQGISLGNGKIRWSYDGVGTETRDISYVKQHPEIYGNISFLGAQRPCPGYGWDPGDGNKGRIIPQQEMIDIVDKATEFLVSHPVTGESIPFPDENRIRDYIEALRNGTWKDHNPYLPRDKPLPGNLTAEDFANSLEEKLKEKSGSFFSGFPWTPYINCINAVILGENEILEILNKKFGTDYKLFDSLGNTQLILEIRDRNCAEPPWISGTAIKGWYPLPQHCKDISVVASFDPNDKVGSQGTGEEHFLYGKEPLRYSVLFENLETATAPAQEVIITDQLDVVNMDLNTLSLGPIAFGDNQVIPPSGLSNFATDVDLRPDNNLIVRITVSLNTNTGLLIWRFTSIDPATGDFPEDPLAGFLPPNINPPEGDGSVLFTVMPKEGLPTGTEIRNRASIVFDVNPPIETPEWLNTLDNTKPTSQVLPLALTQSSTDFLVEWSGVDEGAGIRDYTVFVSEDGEDFIPFVERTPDTSAMFSGEPGITYEFFSIATDLAGNVETKEPIAEAVTTILKSKDPLAGMEVVDGSIQQSVANVRFDRVNGLFSLDLIIQNISDTPLLAPFIAVVTSISLPLNVTVADTDGETLDGMPYWDYSSILIDGELLAGESVVKRIAFKNPRGMRFTYTIQVFSKVGE